MEYLLDTIIDELKQYSMEHINGREEYFLLNPDDNILYFNKKFGIISISTFSEKEYFVNLHFNALIFKMTKNLSRIEIMILIWSMFDNDYFNKKNIISYNDAHLDMIVDYTSKKIEVVMTAWGFKNHKSLIKYSPIKNYKSQIEDIYEKFGYVQIVYSIY